MPTVPDAPTGRQEARPLAAVELRDPDQVRRWLAACREAVLDCAAAGEDATRPPKQRVLSRFEARRRIEEAEASLLGLLDAAERGLSPIGSADEARAEPSPADR